MTMTFSNLKSHFHESEPVYPIYSDIGLQFYRADGGTYSIKNMIEMGTRAVLLATFGGILIISAAMASTMAYTYAIGVPLIAG